MHTINLLAVAAALTLGTAEAALISHYTFDETSGTTAVDKGSAGANGTIGANVTLGAAGKFGTAFTFHNDATQAGIVDMENATTFAAINASQAVTISVWLKWATSTANRDTAVFLGSNAASDRYLDVGTTGGTNTANLGGVFGRTRAATTFPDLIRGAALNDGQWHHVAYTANATTDVTQIYIDGVLAGSTTTPLFTFPAFNNFEVGRLGRSAPTDAYDGSVDELRIYDSVLTAGEIASLAQGAAGDPSMLVEPSFSFTSNGVAGILSVPFSNNGASQTLTLSSVAPVTISGDNAANFSLASFDNNLAPGATGAIRLNFNPQGGGTYNATLTIASNDSLKPSRDVAVSVEVRDPVAGIAPALIDFGSFATAPSPQTQTLTISNTGGATDLTVFDVASTGSAAFTTNAAPPFAVAPGGSTTITVTFTPGSSDGNFTGNLQVITDGFNQGVFDVPLSASVKLSSPDASMVSHFTFDQQAAVGDDTGTLNNDGTPVGDAQWTASSRIGGGALLLDGTGDLIDLGADTGPDYTSQLVADSDGFTVACWANVPVGTTVDRTRFFSAYANGAATLTQGWGVGQRNASRQLIGTTYGKVDYLAPVNSAPALGAWHHYAYVFRNVPVNRLDTYIDGVLVDSRTTATNTGFNDATTVGFAIGALGRSTAFEGFAGRLDDLRIYNRELVASNIADLFNSAPPQSAYDVWASTYGLNPAGNGAPSQDPDGDGLANSVEFVVGSSPVSGSSANLPAGSKSGNNLVIVYRRETAAAVAGFVDRVEFKDDMSATPWTPAVNGSGGVTISSVAIDADTEEVTVSIPSPGSRMFARLSVTAPQ
ncbi:LamG-like jellyroll fold domain-containing protein [Luteolibacter soli]|uniref:LamG-like jellyroll fold domain-containing protein n=1 Tax=Luteolibacter soli TaxID=3135280 RepID=A0ABU9AW76_9BACT